MKQRIAQIAIIIALVGAAFCILMYLNGCDSTQTAPVAKTVQLNWIAPGDDGFVGQAERYDGRYSTDSAQLVNNFNACPSIAAFTTKVPAPGGARDSLQFTVSVETGVTYYFALKAADEVPNWSQVSNLWSAVWADIEAPVRITDLTGKKL